MMMISIANAQPRNIESIRVNDIIPSGIQSDAQNLVKLLEYYYDYLNSSGMPSTEIQSIYSTKDIDSDSLKYLNQIEELIGKTIPKSNVLNKVELYKIIIKYYSTRGSEDSIHTFFKIFFNELVEIIYPKEQLFKLSEGLGSWTSDRLIIDSNILPIIRKITDVKSKEIDGISYKPLLDNGSGQLISIRYKGSVLNQRIIDVSNDNGLLTVTPGSLSRLKVLSDDVIIDFNSFPIPEFFYYIGQGLDDKPMYSQRLDSITQWESGEPSTIAWDGTKWIFSIGSNNGLITTFYSLEDVDGPELVTEWFGGWEIDGNVIAGSINLIEPAQTVNGQIFFALLNVDNLSSILEISTNVNNALFYTPFQITPERVYFSSNYLPTIDIIPDQIAVVNGMVKHPYVTGVSVLEPDFGISWKQSNINDEWIYEDKKSFLSDEFKVFDGYYWQDYSYVIKSDLDSSVWYDEYLKFVHPAGLKLFSAAVIEIVLRNEWYDKLNYVTTGTDDKWLKSLIPPHNLDINSIGYHTPKYQPGFLRDQLFRYVFTYLFDKDSRNDYVRLLLIDLKILLNSINNRNSVVRNRYQNNEKFIDVIKLGDGLLDKTIAEFEEPYSPTNNCKLINFSTIVTINSRFGTSYYDTDYGQGEGVWFGSSYEYNDDTPPSPWNNSSIELDSFN